MVMGADGNHPELTAQLGKEITLIQGNSLAVKHDAVASGQKFAFRLAAEQFKPVRVHLADDGLIPGISPPLRQNGLDLGPENFLKHGADPVQKSFEGVGGVRAVVVRPEYVDEFRLGNAPIPMYDEIGQHVPQLLRTVDFVGQNSAAHFQAEAAQQID